MKKKELKKMYTELEERYNNLNKGYIELHEIAAKYLDQLRAANLIKEQSEGIIQPLLSPFKYKP